MIPLDAPDPQAVYRQLRHELEAYSPELAAKPHVVLLTKADLLPSGQSAPHLDAPEALEQIEVSSVSRRGLDELIEKLWARVTDLRGVPEQEPAWDQELLDRE
jgi:GTP-binding protein